MKVLLVAATGMEVNLLTDECKFKNSISDNLKSYNYNGLDFDLLLTGIGPTFTTFCLTQTLVGNSYSLVIDTGIAGSLSEQVKIGDVVSVVEEEFADLGIEKEEEFLTLFDSGYMHSDEFPFENRVLKADKQKAAAFLPQVKGVTTGISHGRESSILALKNRFSANVESMEGAAVFYVCRWLGVPCLEIRAISNMVVPRSQSKWDIPLALENLKNTLMKVLSELSAESGDFAIFAPKLQNMKLTLGFSTCPNDTFVFDAMIHGKIDTEGLTFDVILSDVEDLNRKAFEHTIQVTKLSYHAFAYVSENYVLLNAGSALGRKNGPLLISRFPLDPEMVKLQRIAIPGKYTTANLLFSMFFPDARDKREYLFSEIEDALLNNEVDAGVIIHENRFTFEKRGLVKLFDLGERWENKTGLPIPLGGIAADKSLPADVLQKIDRVMAKSVAYALQNPDSSQEFVKEYARELDNEVIRQHIALYVNDFTLDLGKEGRDAIVQFFREARLRSIIPAGTENYFLKK